MRYEDIIAELEKNKDVRLRVSGNSMTPKFNPGDHVTLSPLHPKDSFVNIRKGDTVLCKVRGHYYIHLVTAIGDDGRLQISNNHGHVNGWTRQVYGVITSVEAKKN